MEARFVDAFRNAAVPWRVIRLCTERARALYGADHPFATQRFRTDGRTIFAEIARRAGEAILDLARSQLAFARVICQSLYARYRLRGWRHPARWWPLGRQTPIVLDPARSFGQPIVRARRSADRGACRCGRCRGLGRQGRPAVPGAAATVQAAGRFEQRAADRLAA
jgi:hypothetical protein